MTTCSRAARDDQRRPWLPRRIPGALFLALTLLAPAAEASPEYAEVIQESLGLDCPPRCTLCHQDNQGGLGTIRGGSFGESLMYVADLHEDDPATLRCALELIRPGCEDPPACAGPDQICIPTDTDGDGMTDFDELSALRDPNTAGEGALCGATYGCGAELSPPPVSRTSAAPWVTLAAAVTALRLEQLRRKRR